MQNCIINNLAIDPMKHVSENFEDFYLSRKFFDHVEIWSTQTELSQRTGITQSRLSRITDKNIKLYEYMNICKALELDPAEYLF